MRPEVGCHTPRPGSLSDGERRVSRGSFETLEEALDLGQFETTQEASPAKAEDYLMGFGGQFG